MLSLLIYENIVIICIKKLNSILKNLFCIRKYRFCITCL